jgi:hypothetical protein
MMAMTLWKSGHLVCKISTVLFFPLSSSTDAEEALVTYIK